MIVASLDNLPPRRRLDEIGKTTVPDETAA